MNCQPPLPKELSVGATSHVVMEKLVVFSIECDMNIPQNDLFIFGSRICHVHPLAHSQCYSIYYRERESVAMRPYQSHSILHE